MGLILGDLCRRETIVLLYVYRGMMPIVPAWRIVSTKSMSMNRLEDIHC